MSVQGLPSAANVIVLLSILSSSVWPRAHRQTSFAARNANLQTETTTTNKEEEFRKEKKGATERREWPKDKWLFKCSLFFSKSRVQANQLPTHKKTQKEKNRKRAKKLRVGNENVHQEMPSRVHKTIHCLLVDVSYMWRSRIHTQPHMMMAKRIWWKNLDCCIHTTAQKDNTLKWRGLANS